MQDYFKNRRFLSIFLLISIAAFLVLPKISLADDFQNINQIELGKYLEMDEKDTQNLLFTLKQVFTTDWIYRESSGYSTEEESLVPLVLRKIVRIQALNHLLIDAPIEITWGIIKNAIKIAKVFLTKDISVVLDELEKESVKRAVEYGKNFLFQNEIKVTPGAIEYAYASQRGIEQKVVIQYILIYQPLNNRNGNVIIRFYSPQPIDPPRSEGAWGMTGTPHSVQGKLPPFIVEITGRVEKDNFNNYWWINEKGRRFTEGTEPVPILPLIRIEFPHSVPDLGIKPLTFWERHVLKPIESTIKDIEVIITKVTGISPKIVEKILKIPQIAVDIWNEIKSTFSKINPFSPAALVETPAVEKEKPPAEVGQEVGQKAPAGTKVETLKTKPQTEPKTEPNPLALSEVEGLSDLEKMQEELDDIAERIDIMSQEVAKLVKEKGIKEEQEEKQEIEELEEKEEKEEKEEEEEEGICNVNINTASKKELQKLTGVGPVIAQRIIEARPFSSIYDLIKVSRIGEKTLQKIIDQDCAYVEGDRGPFIPSSGGGGTTLPSSPATYPKILISEIQTEGQTAKDEFIELYNPNSQSVDLTGWALKKKTSGGNESNLVSSAKFSGIIPFGSYFLIVPQPNDDGSPNYQGLALPDLYYSGKTYSIADNNTVLLYDPNGNLVDKVGFGFAQDFETAPAENPLAGKSLGRKWLATTQSYIDTDDNSADFEIQNPTPKAQNQSPEPEQGEEKEEEEPEQPEQPQLPQTIVINEVAWMGTKASASDEWVEFYNPGDSEVDIADWSIYGADTEGCLNFSEADGAATTIIPPGGYLIYASHKTDIQDVTWVSIVDIWDASIGMNNSSPGRLILYDALDCQGNIIDIVNQESGDWFAGKASPDYISMERVDSQESGSNSENWQDNNLIIVNGMDKDKNQIFGTPKAKNSVSYQPPITLPQHINRDITLTTSYSPYIVQGHTTIWQNFSLTIEPGVILKFWPKEGNVDSQLQVLGTLKAIGAENEKIIFTSLLDDLNDLDQANLKDIEKDTNQDGTVTSPYPGAWKWILFGSPEPNINPTLDSELVNVLIRYGDADNAGVIKVEKGSSITIKDSRLEKNKRGIWLVSSPNTIIDGVEFVDNNFLSVEIQNAGSPTIKNSNFEGKEGDQIGISVGAGTSPRIENNFFTKNKTPIIMYAGSVPILTGNRGENNQLNGIVLSPSGGPYPEGINSIIWSFNEDFPYIIEDSWRVNSGITLKIEPGTVIKFGSLFPIYWADRRNAYFEIQGELFAEGADEGNPIVFTSLRDDYGGDTNNDGLPRPEEQGPDWRGIVIKSQASATLKWLKLRYAGAEGSDPLTIEEGANVSPDPDERAIVIEP